MLSLSGSCSIPWHRSCQKKRSDEQKAKQRNGLTLSGLLAACGQLFAVFKNYSFSEVNISTHITLLTTTIAPLNSPSVKLSSDIFPRNILSLFQSQFSISSLSAKSRFFDFANFLFLRAKATFRLPLHTSIFSHGSYSPFGVLSNLFRGSPSSLLVSYVSMKVR
jgi:hypothetical protein